MQTTSITDLITLARGPWTPKQIICSYIDDTVYIDLAVRERISALKTDASNRFHNGLGYRLDDFALPSDADGTLCLSLRPTDYFSMLATDNALDEPIVIGDLATTLRDYYEVNPNRMRTRPPIGIASLFGVTLQILTSDNYGIFCKRSNTATHSYTMYPSLGDM
ncbi:MULTISPECIES: hypothetical protein [Ferrimicrobium]|jgi:hypothetical protein|uniref:hypothetical protein n=1 Tax=Ferrimicrobium TaxID=121038 RepID=UPI0023F494E7|nr:MULTISPECIES: hypothetical protein [Ferrimicrobium]